MSDYLDHPLTLVGLCAVIGGILLLVTAWAFTGEYERGGRDSQHRRPRKLEPWHVEPSGERPIVPDTKVSARHRLDTVREETTNLGAYAADVASARARVVMIGPEGIEDGNHTRTTRRLRQVEKEHGEEEGRAHRERGEDESRPLEDGEEGSGDAEAPSLSWFRHPGTGEYIFVDAAGRQVEWDNGEEERYPS
jgi:hypothetical protein